MDFKEIFNLWLEAVKNPKETFSEQKRKANFTDGSVNVLLGGLIAGLIGGIYYGTILGIAAGAVGGAIASWVGWIISGGIYYIFAKILGGKGEAITQIYLMSLYIPLITIVTTLVSPIPFASILVTIFGLYLLTLALKEAHSYTTIKAMLSWLIPILIIIAIVFVLLFFAFTFAVGLLETMAPEYTPMIPAI